MYIKQISVFLENKPGRLAALTKALGEKGVDIIALSIADTSDFGILRCIVNKPDEALAVIRDAGFTASTTDVLAVEVQDRPGGLAEALQQLHEAGIAIEYIYSFVRKSSDRALILFRVENNDAAMELFKRMGISTLSPEDIYQL